MATAATAPTSSKKVKTSPCKTGRETACFLNSLVSRSRRLYVLGTSPSPRLRRHLEDRKSADFASAFIGYRDNGIHAGASPLWRPRTETVTIRDAKGNPDTSIPNRHRINLDQWRQLAPYQKALIFHTQLLIKEHEGGFGRLFNFTLRFNEEILARAEGEDKPLDYLSRIMRRELKDIPSWFVFEKEGESFKSTHILHIHGAALSPDRESLEARLRTASKWKSSKAVKIRRNFNAIYWAGHYSTKKTTAAPRIGEEKTLRVSNDLNGEARELWESVRRGLVLENIHHPRKERKARGYAFRVVILNPHTSPFRFDLVDALVDVVQIKDKADRKARIAAIVADFLARHSKPAGSPSEAPGSAEAPGALPMPSWVAVALLAALAVVLVNCPGAKNVQTGAKNEAHARGPP